jgi:hypothetical protein
MRSNGIAVIVIVLHLDILATHIVSGHVFPQTRHSTVFQPTRLSVFI